MNAEGLINVCQAITHGNLRQVRNTQTNKIGTVTHVEGNTLTVIVQGTSEAWPYENCEEHPAD